MTFELLLGQSIKITNWLTPVWLLSLGIGLGFLLVLGSLLKIWVLSKIPVINSIGDRPTARLVAGIILGFVYTALGIFLYYVGYGINFKNGLDESLGLFLLFLIPICLYLGYGAWGLFNQRGLPDVFSLFKEGFLYWLNVICLAMATFGLLGFLLAPFNGFGVVKFVGDPSVMMNSLGRMPFAGTFSGATEIQPTPVNGVGEKIDVSFFGQEVRWFRFKSNQELEIATEPINAKLSPTRIFKISASSANEPRQFVRRADGKGRIPNGHIDSLYVVNRGNGPAEFQYEYLNQPIYNQVWLIPWGAAIVLAVYLLYLVSATMFPKVFAIVMSTFKTEISQPLFLILMLIGVLFVVGSIYVPYNTFGEDIKMYKDSGLTLIRVLAIFLAIWAASKSVAEEIEGRTALTVLSKPVGRRQFILGKLGGITLAVALLFIVLGVWFVIWTAYKPIYDGVESAKGTIEWETCFKEATSVIPALFLGFLEVVIFVSISIAISTRFGILANFLICFSIYVLGHLTPLIVQSSAGEFELVHTFGNLIAIIFPVLDHFDVQAAINTSRDVPMIYLGWSVIYCLLYGSITMLVALVLFEDRDLA